MSKPRSPSDWILWTGQGIPNDNIKRLPDPPPWRTFEQRDHYWKSASYRPGTDEIAAVNAALYLRRPLLVTGQPGSGKSTLAYAVASELKLGELLHWPVNSRTKLTDGLYHYDAIARLRDANLAQARGKANTYAEDIGYYLTLGPLGTALLPVPKEANPRVLLIDEIDKSDMDFPNDLLHVFEEGEFNIPELQRLAPIEHQDVEHDAITENSEIKILPWGAKHYHERVTIVGGRVRCTKFPFVVITSNGERELPPPFLRRCIQLKLNEPDLDRLRKIIAAHLDQLDEEVRENIMTVFLQSREEGKTLATDQLLNAMYLVAQGRLPEGTERHQLLELLFHDLGSG